MVLAQHRARWVVAEPGSDGEPRLLSGRGRLREQPPVTGDWVAVDEGGAIAAVLERRGALSRRAAGEVTAAQVLAANVDLALLVDAAPDPNERRLERLHALAAAGGVPSALVVTKADLADDAQLVATQIARRLGIVDAVSVSALRGDGVTVLRTLLDPGATAVLLGASGAGKSTLANELLGEERMRTQPVRAHDGRGRHTTVTRELIALPTGALLIDTPGIREGRAVGRGRRRIRRHRHTRRKLPLRRLLPRERAGLCGARRGRARAARGVAQARARAGPPRRPQGGRARAQAARALLRATSARRASAQGKRRLTDAVESRWAWLAIRTTV